MQSFHLQVEVSLRIRKRGARQLTLPRNAHGINLVYESVCAECVAENTLPAKLLGINMGRMGLFRTLVEPWAQEKPSYVIVGRQKTFIFMPVYCLRKTVGVECACAVLNCFGILKPRVLLLSMKGIVCHY